MKTLKFYSGIVDTAIPPDFKAALLSLRGHQLRPEFLLQEVPAPAKIAPYAAALTGDVTHPEDSDSFIGSGRFVILYDPAGQAAWEGTMRIIVLSKAQLEPEMGEDPFLGEVGWAWLTDALQEEQAAYHALSGTVTRALSETFGGLELHYGNVHIEIRASWTPKSTDLAPHLRAWALTTCQAAGLPPDSENVSNLPDQSWFS